MSKEKYNHLVAPNIFPKIPSHLGCPYYPAQAMPNPTYIVAKTLSGVITLYEYVCPAKHKFLVQER